MKLSAKHLKDNQFEGMMTTNDLEITWSENWVSLFITTKSGQELPVFSLCIAKQVGKYFDSNGADIIEKMREWYHTSKAAKDAGKVNHSFNLNFWRILREILFDAFEESLSNWIPIIQCEVRTNGTFTVAVDPIEEDPLAQFMSVDLNTVYASKNHNENTQPLTAQQPAPAKIEPVVVDNPPKAKPAKADKVVDDYDGKKIARSVKREKKKDLGMGSEPEALKGRRASNINHLPIW